MINGKEFAEKMFSDVNNDNTQEKLYSTGSEELDAMLEKAFSEGYEYAQREFGIIGKSLNRNIRKSTAKAIRNQRKLNDALGDTKTVSNAVNRIISNSGYPVNGEASWRLKNKIIEDVPLAIAGGKRVASDLAKDAKKDFPKGGSTNVRRFLETKKDLRKLNKESKTAIDVLTGKKSHKANLEGLMD